MCVLLLAQHIVAVPSIAHSAVDLRFWAFPFAFGFLALLIHGLTHWIASRSLRRRSGVDTFQRCDRLICALLAAVLAGECACVVAELLRCGLCAVVDAGFARLYNGVCVCAPRTPLASM